MNPPQDQTTFSAPALDPDSVICPHHRAMLVAANRTEALADDLVRRMSKAPVHLFRGARGVWPRFRAAYDAERLYCDSLRVAAYLFARHLERVRPAYAGGLRSKADALIPLLDEIVETSWKVRRFHLEEPRFADLENGIKRARRALQPVPEWIFFDWT